MSNKKQELLLPKVPVEGKKDKLDQFKSKIKADLATALSSKPKVFYLYERLPRSLEQQEEKDIEYLKLSGYEVINEFTTSIWQEYNSLYGQLIDAHVNIELAHNAGMPPDEDSKKLLALYPELEKIPVPEIETLAYKIIYLELLKSADIFAFRRTKDGEVLCTEALAFAQEQGIFTMDLTEIVDLVAEWNTSAKNTTSISSSIFHITKLKRIWFISLFSLKGGITKELSVISNTLLSILE